MSCSTESFYICGSVLSYTEANYLYPILHKLITLSFLRESNYLGHIQKQGNGQKWADRYFGPLVRWSAAQRTTVMLANQWTGKNSGPAPADYRN
jgi:hypothetical protein